MNTIKKSQGSMSPIESSFPTTPEYSTAADVQEKCIKFNLMKIIKALKEDLCKSLKEIEENTSKKNWRKWINPLQKAKKEHLTEMNKSV